MGIDPTAFIHPKAHVESSSIGAKTKVWQFASVIRGSRLGSNCNVASNATIDGAWIGNDCIICPGAFVVPGTLVDDQVFIGPNVVICNDRWPSAYKDHFEIELLFGDFVSVHLKTGASIGANSTVLPGVTIGRHAVVSAGAVATCNVPDFHLLTRPGNLVEIRPEWRKRRMREAA